MKRLISLILALILLAVAAGAAADGKHCDIRVKVVSGERETGSDIQIYLDNGEALITSSLVPGTGIRSAALNPEELLNAASELSLIMNNGRPAEAVLACVKDWVNYMQPVTREGYFSGDAFETASIVQEISFSYGDLLMLGRKIRAALQDEGIELPDGDDLLDMLTPQRNVRLDLKIFDEGKYASLNVLKGEDTVMTVSANLSDPDCLLLVTGYGFGGKNYYSRILAEKSENRLDMTEMLYADDVKAGYTGLGDNALICTENVTAQLKNDEISISASLFPANGLTPIMFEGTVRNADTGRFFEGELKFSGNNQFRTAITADMDESAIGEIPANMVDLDSAGETELTTLGIQIGGGLMAMLMQVIELVPEEYQAPVRNIIGI